MGKDFFGFLVWSSGLLAFVNLILLIVTLVQRKLSAVEAVILIVAAFVLPLAGLALGGYLVEEDNPFAVIGLGIVGLVLGFVAAMYGDFIYLMVKLLRKPKPKEVLPIEDDDTLDMDDL